MCFEDAGEVALGGEAQVIADGEQTAVSIPEQVLCLVDLDLLDEIRQIDALLLFETCGQIASAEMQRLGDILCSDGVRQMVMYV